MELITKLVVLATAIVGLYKAATFDRAKFAAAVNEGPFAPFLHMAGMLLFMLAIPGFLWGFTYLMSNMPGMKITPAAPQELVPTLPLIPADAKESEILLIAAKGLPTFQSEAGALATVVSHALSQRDFRTATRAALLLPSSTDQERELWNVIKAMTEPPGNPAALPPQQPASPTP